MPAPDSLHRLPSVASLLETGEVKAALSRHPRAVVVGALRRLLDSCRKGAAGARGSREEWTALVLSRLDAEIAAGEAMPLRRVINATGVVVHTNLGRAPLAREALEAVLEAARGYSNLEYDLDAGRRSKRLVHVERMLLDATGAEAVHVVNNNAAAVFLCLAVLARGREVIVSRGELVEIGGSFRIPDIMAASGAVLVEVGTTNRTRPADYERAITDRTALLLKVHRSNFAVVGFTEEASARELSAIGAARSIPVVEDLGSGALFDFARAKIPGEPTVRQALAEGPAIVTVSGDKLLGGPQAGIIAGKAALVEPLRKHPLSRALRVDKLCLAALAATLRLYGDERRAAQAVPVLRMLLADAAEVRARAVRLVRRVRRAGTPLRLSVEEGVSSPGGGAMPGVEIPTACVAAVHPAIPPERLEARLRRGSPPVVGRVSRGTLRLDMRTVADDEVPDLAAALAAAASPEGD